jgi:hypothetical protein
MESKVKVVRAKFFTGWSMSWNLNLFSGPKFQITCGECESVFEARIPLVSNPRVRCGLCGVINELRLIVR